MHNRTSFEPEHKDRAETIHVADTFIEGEQRRLIPSLQPLGINCDIILGQLIE